MQNQLNYVNSLPNNLKASLKGYTQDLYENVNLTLRRHFKNSPLNETVLKKLLESDWIDSEQYQTLIDMETIFGRAEPLSESITVYRGVDELPKDFPGGGYLSTTYTLENIPQDKDILKIFLSPGIKALPVWSVSQFPSETEIILDRTGIVYDILRCYKIKTYTIIAKPL